MAARTVSKIRGSIVYLPVDEILQSPVQPRRWFCPEGLEELRCSIAEHGILNPLTVRQRSGRYELVAGERRLRAARMAGLTEVPCILVDVNIEESSLLALVENLQRRDLDFLEEAEGINQLIRLFGMSQEEAARRLGKSQSAIANKLRLLRLPSDVLEQLHTCGLTERHGRALLRLPTAQAQRATLAEILDRRFTVAQTDAFIDRLLAEPPTDTARENRRQQKRFVMKDVRIFLNSLTHGLEMMRLGGIQADVRQRETEQALELTIRIPRQRDS